MWGRGIPQWMCGGQRTTCQNWLFLSTFFSRCFLKLQQFPQQSAFSMPKTCWRKAVYCLCWNKWTGGLHVVTVWLAILRECSSWACTVLSCLVVSKRKVTITLFIFATFLGLSSGSAQAKGTSGPWGPLKLSVWKTLDRFELSCSGSQCLKCVWSWQAGLGLHIWQNLLS